MSDALKDLARAAEKACDSDGLDWNVLVGEFIESERKHQQFYWEAVELLLSPEKWTSQPEQA